MGVCLFVWGFCFLFLCFVFCCFLIKFYFDASDIRAFAVLKNLQTITSYPTLANILINGCMNGKYMVKRLIGGSQERQTFYHTSFANSH